MDLSGRQESRLRLSPSSSSSSPCVFGGDWQPLHLRGNLITAAEGILPLGDFPLSLLQKTAAERLLVRWNVQGRCPTWGPGPDRGAERSGERTPEENVTSIVQPSALRLRHISSLNLRNIQMIIFMINSSDVLID